MRSHEYVLLDGINRARIGRYLATASAVLSAGIVFVVLRLFDIATRFGLSINLTPSIMSLIGAGAVYIILYWLFDQFLWRVPKLNAILRVPNLEGTWSCIGISYNDTDSETIAREWTGTVKIAQSWDRLRIRLTTEQSGSNSLVAAIQYDETGEYRLIYNYENDPRIDHLQELRSHVGFCDMQISADQMEASGEYFNGRGRTTFGKMTWSRQK